MNFKKLDEVVQTQMKEIFGFKEVQIPEEIATQLLKKHNFIFKVSKKNNLNNFCCIKCGVINNIGNLSHRRSSECFFCDTKFNTHTSDSLKTTEDVFEMNYVTFDYKLNTIHLKEKEKQYSMPLTINNSYLSIDFETGESKTDLKVNEYLLIVKHNHVSLLKDMKPISLKQFVEENSKEAFIEFVNLLNSKSLVSRMKGVLAKVHPSSSVRNINLGNTFIHTVSNNPLVTYQLFKQGLDLDKYYELNKNDLLLNININDKSNQTIEKLSSTFNLNTTNIAHFKMLERFLKLYDEDTLYILLETYRGNNLIFTMWCYTFGITDDKEIADWIETLDTLVGRKYIFARIIKDAKLEASRFAEYLRYLEQYEAIPYAKGINHYIKYYEANIEKENFESYPKDILIKL